MSERSVTGLRRSWGRLAVAVLAVLALLVGACAGYLTTSQLARLHYGYL